MPPLTDEELAARASLSDRRWELQDGRGVLLIVPKGGSKDEMIGALDGAEAEALGLRAGMILAVLPVHHEGEAE